MARPNKQGIDYFSFDVDFFEDEKIEAISGEFQIKGEITVIKLLCVIYRNGYYIRWNELIKMKLMKNLPGVSSNLLDEIISRLVKWGFFDKNLFDSESILTSRGIQKRYFAAIKRRNKEEIYPYLLIDIDNNRVNASNNEVNAYINPTTTHLLSAKNLQSKGKESKQNKTKGEEKVKKKDAAKAATLVRKTEFYEELIPYVETYGKEMIRAFFDYWSEMNKSETKMRFEQQKTWEISLRLKTWASRDSNQFNKNSDGKTTSITNISGNRSGNRNTSSGTDAENKRREREHLGRLADAILQQSAAENRK